MTITELILETVLDNTPSDIGITCVYVRKDEGKVEVSVEVSTVNPCKNGGEDWVSKRSIVVEWHTLPADIVSEFVQSNEVKRVVRNRKKRS